jgi:LmbE family N-acetylglucosaminyl deacetylase
MTGFRHSDAGTAEVVWQPFLDAAPTVHFGDLPHVQRALVVAPHPDDESLGAGGVIASWSAAKVEVDVVVCSDGESARPGASAAARRHLAQRRADEVGAAVDALSARAPVQLQRWGLPDGRLERCGVELRERLAPLVAAADVVVAPWPGDGHPDHEAVGLAARGAVAVSNTPAPLLEYPIWAWHWATPELLAGDTVIGVPLSPSAQRAKAAAIACHESQHGGDDPILPPAVQAHFRRSEEFFVVDDRTLGTLTPLPRSSPEFFEHLYRSTPSGDPWDFDVSDAEQARYDAVEQTLGTRRFRRAIEIGCATGELTRRLAAHAAQVVAVDSSASALRVAAATCRDVGGVELRQGHAPDCFRSDDVDADLVVLSEVGYYFSADTLADLVRELADRSAPGCIFVAAHWTGSSPDHVLDADTTHSVIASALGWTHRSSGAVGAHRIDVWEQP